MIQLYFLLHENKLENYTVVVQLAIIVTEQVNWLVCSLNFLSAAYLDKMEA